MCLITKQLIPLVAEEDIICYKVVDTFLKGPMYGFTYEIGKEYTLEKSLVPRPALSDGEIFIYEGFHTYSDLHDASKCSFGHYWNIKMIMRDALGDSGKGVFVLVCLIPKGANYFKNKTEIVSDKLKVIKLIKENPYS